MYGLLVGLELFARAGGGGSSSGGEGLAMLPAAAGYVIASRLRKQSKPLAIVVASVVVLTVSLLYLLVGWVWFILALIAGAFGIAGGLAGVLGKFRKNSKQAEAAALQAARLDSAWNQQAIIDNAVATFNRFQYDWGRMDLASIQQYTTPEYAKHIGLMLYAMQQMGRQNTMTDIVINEAILTGVHDDADNQQDRVSVGFAARAHDVLTETATGRQLTVNNAEFGEQWNFVRDDAKWLLYGIDQATEDAAALVVSLRAFATQNGMYFSPDWGNLLLPERGQLFKQGFKNTDINNHVIGFWQGDLLVQLYTYGESQGDSSTHYMIGQVNLPKSYGGILVLRRNGLFGGRLFKPSGYKKVTLEWGDFNKRYDVYATDENQVTSFELLNPAFMAWLYDQNIKVNIEVVDNIVYLYSKVSAHENRYAEMLEILKRSHKELKL